MSGIGVLTNPRSRHNRQDPSLAAQLRTVLGELGEVAAPDSLPSLAQTARRFRDRDIDVLCVHGGDGTVHQAVTAMVAAYETAPLPPLALLRGGTMNIIADSVGVRCGAAEMLQQVVDARAESGALLTTQRPALRIEASDAVWHGFLSGNGIIARFLEVYYERPDPTPVDAGWLLARGAASALVGGRLIRQLMHPWNGRVHIDGIELPRAAWTALAVGTVEQMGLGFKVFHLLDEQTDHLQVVSISSSVSSLARELPSVFRGRGVHRPGNATTLAQTVRLDSEEPIGLMIDGDFYVADGPVHYSVGPSVRFMLPRS